MASSSAQINEYKLDIEDMTKLIHLASRRKSKELLSLEIKKVQTELIEIQSKLRQLSEDEVPKPRPDNSEPKCYDVKLNNYAWDQSDKFVKLYISLEDVGDLPLDQIICEFQERSVSLRVLRLNNKNYELTINNLCEEIVCDQCSYKTKANMIVISLYKKISKKWSCVTSVEKRLKEAKTSNVPKANDSSDPNESLMSLMRKMYQEGDDEMRKTIAKAWTESHEKNMKTDDFDS